MPKLQVPSWDHVRLCLVAFRGADWEASRARRCHAQTFHTLIRSVLGGITGQKKRETTKPRSKRTRVSASGQVSQDDDSETPKVTFAADRFSMLQPNKTATLLLHR